MEEKQTYMQSIEADLMSDYRCIPEEPTGVVSVSLLGLWSTIPYKHVEKFEEGYEIYTESSEGVSYKSRIEAFEEIQMEFDTSKMYSCMIEENGEEYKILLHYDNYVELLQTLVIEEYCYNTYEEVKEANEEEYAYELEDVKTTLDSVERPDFLSEEEGTLGDVFDAILDTTTSILVDYGLIIGIPELDQD